MIDWSYMLGKLRGKYGSLEKVGKDIGVTGTTLRAMDQGKSRNPRNPRFDTGFKVVNLFVREFPDHQSWAEKQMEKIL